MGNILVDETHSLSKGATPALNLEEGGQQGATTDPKRWVSSASYTRQKLIAVLIEAPSNMQYMDDGASRIAMLKNLVELRATSITGLTSKLNVNFGETKVNNAGELHHTATKVNREVSTPSFVWPEKRGKAIFNFFNQWIMDLIADPETGHPGLITSPKWQEKSAPFLPDAISMTVLFIEPSDDLTAVTSAWLTTNMMPKTSGEDEGKRVIGDDNEQVEHTIEFTGTTQIGDHVMTMAKSYLDGLNKAGFQPAALPASYDGVGVDVKAAEIGYADKVAETADSVVE